MCVDKRKSCPSWAAQGDCKTNGWTERNCRISCKTRCDTQPVKPKGKYTSSLSLAVFHSSRRLLATILHGWGLLHVECSPCMICFGNILKKWNSLNVSFQVLVVTGLVLDGLETTNYPTAHSAHHRNTGPVSFICVRWINLMSFLL